MSIDTVAIKLLGEAIDDLTHAKAALSHYAQANPDAQEIAGRFYMELDEIGDALDTLYSDHHIDVDDSGESEAGE